MPKIKKKQAEQELVYKSCTKIGFEKFTEMFSTVQDLILAFISHGARVLPDDLKHNTPSPETHTRIIEELKRLKLEGEKNNGKIDKNRFVYQPFYTTKDVFLSCINEAEQRKKLSSAIVGFKLNENKKIKIILSKKFVEKLDKNSILSFKKDITMFECIINVINNNFNKRLPEALKKGRMLIENMKTSKIPDTARAKNDEIER